MAKQDFEGAPQGATTDRYELGTEAAAVVKERRPWRRWSDVPIWYRVLDRFGLPTIFALVALYIVLEQWRQIRTDWGVQNQALIAAIGRQTEAIQDLAEEVRQALARNQR